MNKNLMRFSGLSVTALTLGVLAGAAQGQAVVYDNPFLSGRKYSLLNGDLLALYVNDRGDLGAPRRSGTKPVGFANGPTPFINPDGSPNTDLMLGLQRNGTYGALYSETPTAGAGSLAGSVSAKQEYFTVGPPPGLNALEGFAVSVGSSWFNGSSPLFNLNPTTGFTVPTNGTTATGPLTASSILHGIAGAAANLQITQTIGVQSPDNTSAAQLNSAKFTVKIKNTSTTATLSNVRYARAIDPNQGYTNGYDSTSSTGGQTSTTQRFGTGADPDAFAVRSLDSPGATTPRSLAIGVLPTDINAGGTTILSVRESDYLNEGALLGNPLNFLNNPRVVLNDATGGASYFDASGTEYVTGDFTDLTSDPFHLAGDPSQTVTPSFRDGDVALLLLSPIFTLSPGEEETFIFYYFFGNTPTAAGPVVPEVGTLTLLLGSLSGGALLLRRRRRG